MNRIALKRIALVLALSAVIGAAQAGDGAPDLSKVNGSLVAEAGRTYGDIDTVNGSITVEAKAVARNVETVNGSIKLLSLNVGGGVETVNGNITVDDGSVVGGNVTVKKPSNWGMSWGKPKVPRIVLGPNSTVKGNLVFEREVELYVHNTAKYGKIIYLEAEAGKAETLKPVVFTGKEPDFK